jgi:site-specific DNA recombinase
MNRESALDGATRRAVLYLRVSTPSQVNTDFDPEGISIPAQREVCQRKAASLGLEIVGEYVEPGRSATTVDKRIAYREMLARIRTVGDVDCVLVYKLSRMNRNRIEDALVVDQLRKMGVTLLSATEAIDGTRTGQLLHGVVAAVNEFRSAEDGADISDKMAYKASRGGTVGLAPIGYLNTKTIVDERKISTVAIDEERAPHVRRAFELYATGEYSVKTLHAVLTADGLRTRPTAKRRAQPLSLSKLYKLLRNRYYAGYVVHRGVAHPGRHDALISEELFAKVQAVLDERDTTSTKQRTHTHYLRGLLSCMRCGSRLVYMEVKGHGGEFAYYACSRRHRTHACDLPYIAADILEARLVKAWPQAISLDELDRIAIAQALRSEIIGNDYDALRVQRLDATLAKLDRERRKLIEMAYADAIPLDLLKSEQDRIAREQVAARADKAAAEQATPDNLLDVYDQAANALQRGSAAYATADDTSRRGLIRAFTRNIKVDLHDEKIELAEVWSEINRSAAHIRTQKRATAPPTKATSRRNRPRSTQNPGPIDWGQGSKISPLVELRGFEPLTPSMRTRCATGLRHSP